MSAYEISDSILASFPLFREWHEFGCVISSLSSGEPETEELHFAFMAPVSSICDTPILSVVADERKRSSTDNSCRTSACACPGIAFESIISRFRGSVS